MNTFYDKGLNRFATGDIDWINHLIYVSLIYDGEYTPDFAVDEFYEIIPEDAIASRVLLAGKSTDNKGTMDGDNITFVAVPGDGIAEATALVIWREIGFNSIVSPLIVWIDEATEFPVIPDGNDINFVWSNSANKILTLNPA